MACDPGSVSTGETHDDAAKFVQTLRAAGYDAIVYVPCSLLEPLIWQVQHSAAPDIRCLQATNEGEAIALAAGHWLAGSKPAVLIQNSGLGNALNPITSLAETIHMDLLLIVSWRGAPDIHDEPQHQLMGQITETILRASKFDLHVVCAPAELLEAGRSLVTKSGMQAILLHPTAAKQLKRHQAVPPAAAETLPSRRQAIGAVAAHMTAADVVVATTGYTSRDIDALMERGGSFKMVGSMGCAASIGAGVALSRPRGSGRTIILDGDGALSMRLEALITVGAMSPRGLMHILLDNGRHDSTGGQRTNSDKIRFEDIAQACGYATSRAIQTCQELGTAIENFTPDSDPVFLRLRTQPHGDPSPRPDETPDQNAQRLREMLRTPQRPYQLT